MLALGSYFSWRRMRRLYDFKLPPETQIYSIEPGQHLGDVAVNFAPATPEQPLRGPSEYEMFQAILALNPGDGTPIIEKNKMSRKDSDKVLRVTYTENGGYYTLVIDRQ